MSNSPRSAPRNRRDFPYFMTQQTRWSDNDQYGHVNNAVYYHLIDTVVNAYLINAGVLDVENGNVVGLVAETRCTYFSPLVFPEPVDTGLRVARIGRSSVTYEIGLFAGDKADTSAFATFIHVYVDRQTQRPVEIPADLRTAAEQLQR